MKKKILLKLGEIDNEIGVFNEFDEFLLKKSTKRLRIFSRILDICKELIISNVVATKRSVYYRDVNLFGNSERVDRQLHDYPETADKGFFVLLDALNEFCDTIEGITEDDVRASIIEWYSNTTVASTDIVRVK
ncbi:13586_t:CDS:2, partial [Entrophospora sp. SA101]